MAAYLPQSNGYLPYFLLAVSKLYLSLSKDQYSRCKSSLMAGIHTVVCYLSPPTVSLRQFSGPRHPPPTPLLAHVYGVKNVYTSLIRAYAAYQINNQALYDLATFSYMGVLFLFITEMVVWRTVRLREAIFPFVNAGVGLAWTVLAREWYTNS
jgi:hypothetical protein